MSKKIKNKNSEPAKEVNLPRRAEDVGAAKKEDEQIVELKNLLQRTQAEFENYKKRVEREKGDFVCFANADIVCKLLPVFDSLERAVLAMPEDLLGNKWAEGVKRIYEQFRGVLEKEGVEKFTSVGMTCDPSSHEAVLSKPGNKDEVLEELEAGYKLKQRVIRPAKVVVGSGEEDKKDVKDLNDVKDIKDDITG